MDKSILFIILVIMFCLNLLIFVSVRDRFDALEEKLCIHYDSRHSMYVDN